MNAPQRSHPPSVEQLLNADGMTALQERYGRASLLRKVVRDYLAELRDCLPTQRTAATNAGSRVASE